jgi:hypothetical protein
MEARSSPRGFHPTSHCNRLRHGYFSFMDYDLSYIDLEEKTLQALQNPFGPKV